MSKTDVRGAQILSARGHRPFLLDTTSVARASAVGIENLEPLEELEKLELLEELEHLQKLE